MTNDEIGYMNDLSIFVGRKHYDRVIEESKEELTEDAKKVALQELVDDPQKICYGMLP